MTNNFFVLYIAIMSYTLTQAQAQEHIYHVLENDRAPPITKLIHPDSDIPDLRSSFQPSGARPSDSPPLYQDITEINTKK